MQIITYLYILLKSYKTVTPRWTRAPSRDELWSWLQLSCSAKLATRRQLLYDTERTSYTITLPYITYKHYTTINTNYTSAIPTNPLVSYVRTSWRKRGDHDSTVPSILCKFAMKISDITYGTHLPLSMTKR